MTYKFTVIIKKEGKWFVARSLELGVTSQGKTIEEAKQNLQEAVALHLEGENLAEFNLAPHPTLLVTIELEPIPHAA